jgi:hypothetical protein
MIGFEAKISNEKGWQNTVAWCCGWQANPGQPEELFAQVAIVAV